MFTIRDTSGRTLGTVTPDVDIAETLRRVRALTGRTIPVGGPAPQRPRAARRWLRRALLGTAGVFAFGMAVHLASGPESAIATPASAPNPLAVPADDRTGDTPAWYRTEHNGDVISNGETVDNVYSGGSPARARYLAVFAANQVPVGMPNGVVSEGIQFCEDVASGRVVALRELFDSRADTPQYGTGERRATVASAAVQYLCPRFDQ